MVFKITMTNTIKSVTKEWNNISI